MSWFSPPTSVNPPSSPGAVRQPRGMTALALGIVLALTLLLDPVSAQGIVPPDILPPLLGPASSITVERYSVDAVVDGPVATVHVTQVFRNDTPGPVEGTYVFPLPPDAAVSDFQMTVDGQVLEGKLLGKEEARRIYQEIVRRTRDPALLEHLGRGLFQASVFPIPPGESRTIELTYRQVLARDGELFRFSYPLRLLQRGQPVESLALRVELRNQPGLRTIYSPSHLVSIQRQGDDRAVIGFEASQAQPEQDFLLFFGTDESLLGLNLLSYRPAGEEGFFLLLAAPSVDVSAAQVVQRDLVMVLDVSGSMEGEKLAQAKRAAQYVVEHLNPGDRFNLIAFSSGVRFWQGQLQPVGPETQAAALAWVDELAPGGSTDINRALLEALAQLQVREEADRDRPAYALFLTDGLPTQGVTEVERIIDNALANAPERSVRLFTFGVGYDVNTDLLDTVSQELGGRSSYVLPEQRIDEAVSHFYQGISTPVLTDVQVRFLGEDGPLLVEESYPFPLPDLFAGDQLVLVGRYRAGGPVTVTVEGQVNGQAQRFTFPDQELVEAGGEDFVARLWATRKIGALLSQVRRTGANPELVEEIVALSTEYGIVTPFTSYLVLEPDVANRIVSPDAPPPSPPAEAAAEEAIVAAEAYLRVAPAGADAVAASQARQALAQAEQAQPGPQGLRFVAGKSFVQQGLVEGADGALLPLWVDTAYREEMPLETVPFGSEAYFKLAARREVAEWLSVSPELILVVEGKALRITTAEGMPTVSLEGQTKLDGPLPGAPRVKEDDPDLQERVQEILRRLWELVPGR